MRTLPTPLGVAPRLRTRSNVARVRSAIGVPLALLLAASLFNAALCFAYTRGISISLTEIAGSELLIIGAAVLTVWRSLLAGALYACLLIAGWFLVVRLINPIASPKILFDLLMPAAFLAVGRQYGNRELGDRVVLILAGTVLAAGLFEWFFFDIYQNLFNVFGYYVSKGDLDMSHASDTGTTLGENGMRPGERQLLTFLGAHRVGSIFLEPIAVGNFSTILIAWTMARGRIDRNCAFFVFVAFTLAVLADDRFAVFAGMAIAGVVACGLWRWRWVAAASPFVMMALLVAFAWVSPSRLVDNTVAGRLYGSGSALLSQGPFEWLALSPVPIDMDSGYSGLVDAIGVLVPSILWLVFVFQPVRSQFELRYKLGLAIYLALSLCVSGSALSIKTAALAWFLAGSTKAASPGDVATTVPIRSRRRSNGWRDLHA